MAVSGIAQTVPVILSSIAFAGAAASSTSDEGTSFPESEPTMLYYVRNTFVEVLDSVLSCRAPRRTTSAPPRFRFEELADDPQSASVSLQPKLPSSSNSWSTASTSSTHSAGDEEQCDSLGEIDTSDRSDTVSLTSIQEGTPIALADLLPSAVRRPALSSRAKAYSPGCTVAARGCMPADVRQQFAEVVAAGQASLRASTVIQSLGISEDTCGGWSVVGCARQVHAAHVQSAIALAQDAMLSAAEEESSNVYIIGYEVAPFALPTSGLGFTAQIAMVQDENKACWDLLARGYCCRGSSCRWTHPNWQTSVEVSIQLVHSE